MRRMIKPFESSKLMKIQAPQWLFLSILAKGTRGPTNREDRRTIEACSIWAAARRPDCTLAVRSTNCLPLLTRKVVRIKTMGVFPDNGCFPLRLQLSPDGSNRQN